MYDLEQTSIDTVAGGNFMSPFLSGCECSCDISRLSSSFQLTNKVSVDNLLECKEFCNHHDLRASICSIPSFQERLVQGGLMLSVVLLGIGLSVIAGKICLNRFFDFLAAN